VFLIFLQKLLPNKEQGDHPPQAARSFAAILMTFEIIQLFKIAMLKL
jgi:hypothetical protein